MACSRLERPERTRLDRRRRSIGTSSAVVVVVAYARFMRVEVLRHG